MAVPQPLDPELRRRVETAASRNDTSVSEWIERAVRRELEREELGEFGDDSPVEEAPPGAKPQPLSNPPRLRDGSKMSDAVIEDRR